MTKQQQQQSSTNDENQDKHFQLTVNDDPHKPSYGAAMCGVVHFWGHNLWPAFCTTPGRSMMVLGSVPVLGLAMWMRQPLPPLRWHGWIIPAVGCTLVAGATFLLNFVTTKVLQNRQPALPVARKVVAQGVQSGHVVRQPGLYDLYLPEALRHDDDNNNDDDDTQQPQVHSYPAAMIFLPGALVEHAAYAPVAMALARHYGVPVIVQNCEATLRMTQAKAAQLQFLQTHVRHYHGIAAQHWVLAGHSLGGSVAVQIMMQQYQQKQSSPLKFDALVLWGVNGTKGLERTTISTLAISASNDGFQHSRLSDMASLQAWNYDRNDHDASNQPPISCIQRHVRIQGGNHGGFGAYPHQTFPMMDGERTIPLEEQHAQVVQATGEFLLAVFPPK